MAPTKRKTPSSRQHGPKAFVAFDLDLTLGCFQHTNPLSYFWGIETLGSTTQISARLSNKLERVISWYAEALLKRGDLLDLVLRKKIDVIVRPLLFLRSKRLLESVIIYSNSGVRSSLQLAAALIEGKFRLHNFFDLLADAAHPLRAEDYSAPEAGPGDPVKQISTLQALFREATKFKRGSVKDVDPSQILFVDDRQPKHLLAAQEPEGLTYVVPTPFKTVATREQKEDLFFLALDALQHLGLLDDDEYLESPFIKRLLYDGTQIESFTDLLVWVWSVMHKKEGDQGGYYWKGDSTTLRVRMAEYLEKFQPR